MKLEEAKKLLMKKPGFRKAYERAERFRKKLEKKYGREISFDELYEAIDEDIRKSSLGGLEDSVTEPDNT